jgi:transcriptional regulator with AAA-type ATPase domain
MSTECTSKDPVWVEKRALKKKKTALEIKGTTKFQGNTRELQEMVEIFCIFHNLRRT